MAILRRDEVISLLLFFTVVYIVCALYNHGSTTAVLTIYVVIHQQGLRS